MIVRYMLLSAVFMLCANSALMANPFGPPGPGTMSPGYACLNLTPQQTKQLNDLRRDYEKKSSSLKIGEFERKSELRLLWLQINPEPDKILSKSKQINELKWKIQELTITYWMDFRKILTEDQLAKFLTMTGGNDFGPPPEPRPQFQDDRRPPPPRRN